MNRFNPDDFEKVLDSVKHKTNEIVECDDIRSIESNFNTKGMVYKARNNSNRTGTIIVGEDNGNISVDIDVPDGAIRNFVLKEKNDQEGINNIAGWIEENYK